jgi:uncharacterized membrane protein
MGFNILLALVAVLFGWLMKKTTLKSLRIIFGVIWIVFLPNTLYLVTDIVHLFRNMHHVQGGYKLILIFQYFLLLLIGVITYMAAVYPAEKLAREKMKRNQTVFVLLINMLVSFGIILGRVKRVNSWYFITNLPRVLHASAQILTSLHLVLLIFCFTLVSTLLYLAVRAWFPRNAR